MLNRVILIGRIVRDLELRKSVKGTPFTPFTLAVDNGFGDKRTTAFISCFAWEKNAENMVKFLHKGSLISVEGRLNTRSSVVNGTNVTLTEVRVDFVSFLDTKSSNSGSPNLGNGYSNASGVDFDNSFVPEPMPNSAPQAQNNAQQNDNKGVSFDGDDAILWD